MPAASVDVIVTSPPYNLGIAYSKYEDTLSQTDYLRWTDRLVCPPRPACSGPAARSS